jgi:hypothetical protein
MVRAARDDTLVIAPQTARSRRLRARPWIQAAIPAGATTVSVANQAPASHRTRDLATK